MSENNFQDDWNHNWEQEQQQPTPPSQSHALALASFVLAVASLITFCCGFSIMLAPLSILFAILSRGRDGMSDMAKAAIGISGGVLLILLMTALVFGVYMLNNPLEWEEFYQQYMELYSTI